MKGFFECARCSSSQLRLIIMGTLNPMPRSDSANALDTSRTLFTTFLWVGRWTVARKCLCMTVPNLPIPCSPYKKLSPTIIPDDLVNKTWSSYFNVICLIVLMHENVGNIHQRTFSNRHSINYSNFSKSHC